MADYMDLLAQIDANIRRNGAQEITGPILNAVLRLMVTELGSGAVLMGVATTDTQAGTPDGRQAWIAAPGNYPGFGEEVTVPDGTIGVISNISGPWTVQSIPVGKDYSTEIESLLGRVGDADFSGTNYLTKQTDLTGAAKTLDLQVKLAMDEIDTLGASEKNIVNNLLPKKQNTTDPSLETEDKTVVGAINELRSSVPEYTAVPALTSAYTVPANPTATERIYAIAIGATAYPVTGAEGIVWQDGTPPEVEADTTLVVSVINNLGVWGTFKKEA